MNKIIPVLYLIFAIVACGDDNPTDSGQPVVDQSFDLPGGSIEDFSFTVDTDIQQNAILQGEFSVDNGTIQVAVMRESEYQTWLEGGTPVVLYGTNQTSGEPFRLPIENSDTYYIIFRNTSTNTVKVKAEIFLISFSEQDI